MDLVPNHGSNESEWFEKALQGDEKYYDYFVWEDGVIDENGDLQPPNNWVWFCNRTSFVSVNCVSMSYHKLEKACRYSLKKLEPSLSNIMGFEPLSFSLPG